MTVSDRIGGLQLVCMVELKNITAWILNSFAEGPKLCLGTGSVENTNSNEKGISRLESSFQHKNWADSESTCSSENEARMKV